MLWRILQSSNEQFAVMDDPRSFVTAERKQKMKTVSSVKHSRSYAFLPIDNWRWRHGNLSIWKPHSSHNNERVASVPCQLDNWPNMRLVSLKYWIFLRDQSFVWLKRHDRYSTPRDKFLRLRKVLINSARLYRRRLRTNQQSKFVEIRQ